MAAEDLVGPADASGDSGRVDAAAGTPGSGTSGSGTSDSGPLQTQIGLRWGDMDLNGHINNVQFARLLEEGRVRAFTRWFPAGADRLPLLVARQDIEFRAPLYYSTEPVTLSLVVRRIGTSSYTIGSTITAADGTLAAVARTTMVVIDPVSGAPTPIPPSVRAILEANTGDLPDLRPER